MVGTIIYLALLGGLAVFIANFLIQVVGVYNQARSEREILSNGRLIMDTVSKTISSSQKVYAPTSRFNSDAGQLSLVASDEAVSPHVPYYIDFWIDNGAFFMRQEGIGTTTLSAASVRVSKFNLQRIVQGLDREATKIKIQVDTASSLRPASILLNLTAALRGNY